MLSLIAQAAPGGESLPGFITGAGGVTAAVMLATVLWWLLRVHLPAKDALTERMGDKKDERIRELIDRKDQQVRDLTAAFKDALDKVVQHCADEGRAHAEMSERRHAESLTLLQKIHDSARESVHATRNMHASISARQRLADALQSAEVPVWTKSLDGTLLSWNAAAERVLLWKQGEMVGTSIYARLIPPDKRAEEKAVLERIARGETAGSYETVRLAKDGRRVPLEATTSPIRDQTGAVIGASTIARPLDAE
jgi:PAS domain S-box-containing protein